MWRIRFRVVLPIVFGFFTLILLLWTYENDRMVELMGMGWDTGPPLWPYQWIYTILVTVNAPPFVACNLLFLLLPLKNLYLQNLIFVPAVVVWWWWVGSRIDAGFSVSGRFRKQLVAGCIYSIVAIGLLCLAVWEIASFLQWKIDYPDSGYVSISAFRSTGVATWCFLLGAGFVLLAIRCFRGTASHLVTSRRQWKFTLAITCLVIFYFCSIQVVDRSLTPAFDFNLCEYDRLHQLGCVHGIVLEETGKPLANVSVDLIPAKGTEDSIRWRIVSSRTDEAGRYNLNRVTPGEYFLGVNTYEGYNQPAVETPYPALYYPAKKQRVDSETVRVTAGKGVYLSEMRVKSLKLAKVSIRVLWENGTAPSRSNLYAKNLSYPNSIVTAPQIDEGKGTYSLPVGFEYETFASVDCVTNNKHDSHESLPYQRHVLSSDQTAAEWVFILKGPACENWKY